MSFRKSFSLFFFLILVGLPASACLTTDYWQYHVSHSNLNVDLGDYGTILEESLDDYCADAAASALYDKVVSTLGSYANAQHYDALGNLVGPYQGWLEGAHVNLIFASALVLGGKGKLSGKLDKALEKIAYVTLVDPSCGFSGGQWAGQNTCMDDHAIAASGRGWQAAYEAKRGHYFANYSQGARNEIAAAFSTYNSICVFYPETLTTDRGPCSSAPNLDDLATGAAETLSLNHGHQSPAYGFGLMTSIAAAVRGLELTGEGYSFTADQQKIALALAEEAQRKSSSDGGGFKFTNGSVDGCHMNGSSGTCYKSIPMAFSGEMNSAATTESIHIFHGCIH